MSNSEPKKSFSFPLQKMTASWKDIAEHNRKGTVFFVDAHLDILEVGRAVAQDNLPYIQRQIDAGKIYRPAERNISLGRDSVCVFIIVQPYIFVEHPE